MSPVSAFDQSTRLELELLAAQFVLPAIILSMGSMQRSNVTIDVVYDCV